MRPAHDSRARTLSDMRRKVEEQITHDHLPTQNFANSQPIMMLLREILHEVKILREEIRRIPTAPYTPVPMQHSSQLYPSIGTTTIKPPTQYGG